MRVDKSSIRRTPGQTRWLSSPGRRSTITSKQSSTASTTSGTKSRASFSNRPDERGSAHRYCRPMTTASLALPMLVGLVALALAFDFLNGLHDAANSIATVVSTRVLRPFTAVIWAAFFNFVAIAVFGLHVAQTLGTGIIDAGAVNESVIFGALVGAIVWNIASWLLAFPTSSSHALIGGLLGAGIAHTGIGAVVWSGVIKTAFGIVLAPLSGFVIAVALVIVVSWISARSLPFAVDRRFRRLQLLSAALYSLGHGGNDAQKTMGVIEIG